MTRSVATADEGVIPPDTFGLRCAIVRAYLGKNYDQMSRACKEHGTPYDSETFRRWEHGRTQCTDPERAARVMAKIEPPQGRARLSWEWIAYGGPMRAEAVDHPPGPEQEVLSNWRSALSGTSERTPERKVA